MARSELCLALVLCLLLTGCAGASTPAQTAAPLPEVTATPQPQPRFELGEDGLLPVHELCAALGYELDIVNDNAAAIGGKSLEYFPEDGYLCFDGRYLYAPDGWKISGDGLWLEAEAAMKILGLSLEAGSTVVNMDSEGLLCGGDDWYDINCDMDMLYWLPQIINAEAREQPMAGLIGVGNVVMNRMEDGRFPNSVTGVIFDREHVIQFEPVENGSIKAEPDERAYIAACLCLEGYNTVEDSLFFVNPEYGSFWFDSELELSFVIGQHNFYRYPEG